MKNHDEEVVIIGAGPLGSSRHMSWRGATFARA